MRKFAPLISTAVAQAAGTHPFSKTRNWHDRLMAYNKGRGFEMTLIPIPNDPYSWDTQEYKDGAWVASDSTVASPEAATRPESVPATFGNFTGIVEGLSSYEAGEFCAFTYYDATGRTPTHTYKAALDVLASAGFLTAPLQETKGNGWNALEKFAKEEIAHTLLAGVYTAWIVLPSRPRLAESAFRAGAAALTCIDPDSVPSAIIPVGTPYKAESKISTRDAEDASVIRQLLFLVSGRFDVTHAEIEKIIEDDGHDVASMYQDAVDVVVVSSLESRTQAAIQARADGKELVTFDGLKQYLENYNNS